MNNVSNWVIAIVAIMSLVVVLVGGVVTWTRTTTHIEDVSAVLERQVESLKIQVENNRTEIVNAEKGIERLESADVFVKETLSRIENKVDAVYENTSDLKERVSRLEAQYGNP